MSQESINSLSLLTGRTRRTVAMRLEQLTPVKKGKALMYESREALPVIFEDRSRGALDLGQERARLAHHQANRERMREADDRTGLIPAEAVKAYGAAAVTAVEARLRRVREEVRRRFPDAPPEVLKVLAKLHREAMAELGDDGLHTELRGLLSKTNDD